MIIPETKPKSSDPVIHDNFDRRQPDEYQNSNTTPQPKTENSGVVTPSKHLSTFDTNKHVWKQETYTVTSLPKAKPKLNLKPVPEIVKPPTKSTKRPHTYIRRPEITRVQEFAKPKSAYKPWTNMDMKMKSETKSKLQKSKNIMKYSRDSKNIITNRPMTFMTASGQFEPPSTLLFGFKPMTTPSISRPTPYPRTTEGSFIPPEHFGFGFSPATTELNTYNAKSSNQYYIQSKSSDSFLERLSNFFQLISRIMNG